ncbi:hypothetical protein NIES4071_01520 [Calothrix sp. NIES-4071]|nr:hypothetical protein NIES4071_01520 [Calothrix sp. NIES-4071]BAZ54498.1 hypothetical protein NIES4105_01510 [Calothrix sp. NIES-4105]
MQNKNMIKNFDWEKHLQEWSLKRLEILEDYEKEELPASMLESGYLGYPGATEQEIATAEARLGLTFPYSYREFLKVSNGLLTSGQGLKFSSTEEIEWYAWDNEAFIDKCIETWEPVTDEEYFVYGAEQWDLVWRPEYLQTAIEISSRDNGYIFLLNPQVSVLDNEWEAWFCSFSTAWGISRYRSFQEMMENILNDPESIF